MKLLSTLTGKTSKRNTTAVAVVCSVLLGVGCGNENLKIQLSNAKSEANQHEGTILYSGYNWQLVRVNIGGTNYLCNSKGGLIRE